MHKKIKITIIIFLFTFFSLCINLTHNKAEAKPTNNINVENMSEKELAKQMLFLSSPGNSQRKINSLIKSGVGGIGIFYPISKSLGSYIKNANEKYNSAGINSIKPFIASDEEGGLVNRFRDVIGPLPSAKIMGKKSSKTIKNTTYKYGEKLKKYGVNTIFGPVLDRGIKGHYMFNEARAFSSNVNTIYKKSKSWISGYKKAGLITTVKHWPGMGFAKNTHNTITTVKNYKYMKKHDMLSFKKALKSKFVPMVMTAHEKVPGLTKRGLPASLSTDAYKVLRKQAGNSTVFITDSLSMGAITSSLHYSIQKAVVKALKSGADIALVVSGLSASTLIKAVTNAIKNGTIPIKQAIESAKRILKLKQKYGIISSTVKIT